MNIPLLFQPCLATREPCFTSRNASEKSIRPGDAPPHSVAAPDPHPQQASRLPAPSTPTPPGPAPATPAAPPTSPASPPHPPSAPSPPTPNAAGSPGD